MNRGTQKKKHIKMMSGIKMISEISIFMGENYKNLLALLKIVNYLMKASQFLNSLSIS